jgi:DNA polymerase
MPPRAPLDRAGRIRVGELERVDQLEQHAAACTLCRLCRDRTTVVVGSGPHDADVLVVAEAPGYHEDREGRLLAGATGELFDEIMQVAGTRRADVFLTSVVKCRPPAGRAPFSDEVEACEGWLFREIALVQPRVVVTLGALALRLVTGRPERLRDVHGQMLHALVQGRDVVVWPLYHPAAALHVPTLVDELRADARGLGRLLQGARAEVQPRDYRPAPAPTSEPVAPTDDERDELDDGTGEPQLTFDV